MELNPFELIECNELPNKEDVYDFNYIDLVRSVTDKVDWIIEAGFRDYQGDFFFLGKDKDNNIYYIVSGYGSCSGCDALQACDNFEDVKTLRDDLKRSIRKFNSLNEFESLFNKEAQTEWYSTDDVKEFVKEVNSNLSINLSWREEDEF
ncbi:gp241 [Bacillus phage G]|uniref:Gp241 n=1 Tax=Bacillus phage G TaxID=2884420 RepID=G3M9Y2_9CAUD|nr:gp241 [Bacillus phage G]AEO93500.1 gp241 [Bacillus phage G]